jgi:hypothetical protein
MTVTGVDSLQSRPLPAASRARRGWRGCGSSGLNLWRERTDASRCRSVDEPDERFIVRDDNEQAHVLASAPQAGVSPAMHL